MSEKPSKPTLVQLHGGRPPLSDVVGRLYLLAEQIKSGEHGEVTTAYVVLPQRGNYPWIFAFGNIDGDNHPVLQFELAKQVFIQNIMERK